MQRKFSLATFLIGVIASLIPDLVIYLTKVLQYNPQLHEYIQWLNDSGRNYPWQLFIFALAFGGAALATEHPARHAGPSGFIQFLLLVPVGTWLIRFFLLIVTGALSRYGISESTSFYVVESLASFFIYALAAGILNIEVGIFGFMFAPAFAAVTIALSGPPHDLKFLSSCYFSILGIVLSFYMAQTFEKVRRQD